MKLINTEYDEKYESRDDSRRRLFHPDKSYLIYWVDKIKVTGLGVQTKRQMAIVRDYNKETNDFLWVTGGGIVIDADSGDVVYSGITPKILRIFAHMHNEKAIVFELTDSENERQVLMEMF